MVSPVRIRVPPLTNYLQIGKKRKSWVAKPVVSTVAGKVTVSTRPTQWRRWPGLSAPEGVTVGDLAMVALHISIPAPGKLTSSTVPAVALLQFPGLVIWRQHVSPPLRSFAFQGHAVLSMFLKATGRLPRPLSARRSGVSALRCCLPRRSGRLGPAAVPAAQ
jgi:hypothetical protein